MDLALEEDALISLFVIQQLTENKRRRHSHDFYVPGKSVGRRCGKFSTNLTSMFVLSTLYKIFSPITSKALRQGCGRSTLLFNIYLESEIGCLNSIWCDIFQEKLNKHIGRTMVQFGQLMRDLKRRINVIEINYLIPREYREWQTIVQRI